MKMKDAILYYFVVNNFLQGEGGGVCCKYFSQVINVVVKQDDKIS